MTESLSKRRNVIAPLLRDCDRPVELSSVMNDAAILITDQQAYISKLEFVLKWWLAQEKITDSDSMHTINLKTLSELASEALY